MERQIQLATIAKTAVNALKNAMYHVMPGVVVSYDATAETATVQPMTNDVRFDLDSGARISEPWQPIPGIPVGWPRFGGFIIKGDLNPFDPVLLIAFDLDPTSFRVAGRTLKPVDPADATRHAGGYWVALPMDLTVKGTTGSGPWSPASKPGTGSLTIGVEQSNGSAPQPLITITGSTISLGAGASDSVALASKVDAITSALKSFAALFGTAAIVVSSTGVAIPDLQTAASRLADAIESVASSIIKAE